MTRRHFIALATVLADTGASQETIDGVANVCRSENGNFDRDRFQRFIEVRLFRLAREEALGLHEQDMDRA